MRERDDVGTVHQLTLEGVTARDLFGNALRHQPPHVELVFLAPRVRTDLPDQRGELGERRTLVVDRLRQSFAVRLHQVPTGRGLHQVVDAAHQLGLDTRVDHGVERLDRFPTLDGTGDVASDPVGAHDVGRMRAGLGHHPRRERDPRGVHDVVGDDRRDQLTLQRVLGDEMPESLDDGGREVATKVVLLEVLGIWQIGLEELGGDRALRVREQHGELGAHHALTVRASLEHLVGVG